MIDRQNGSNSIYYSKIFAKLHRLFKIIYRPHGQATRSFNSVLGGRQYGDWNGCFSLELVSDIATEIWTDVEI